MDKEIIALIVPSLLSTLSLIISIKTYIENKPKIKINISDKECDAYYGMVIINNNKIAETKIGAVNINITNNSPVDILIKDIKLKIGSNYHRLIDKSNSYWHNCYFFYLNESNERIWDGCEIDYKNNGVNIPNTIKSYSIISGTCLFHNFPNIESKYKNGKIIIYTAVGKIIKKIRFKKYDSDYIDQDMKEAKQYVDNSINNVIKKNRR